MISPNEMATAPAPSRAVATEKWCPDCRLNKPASGFYKNPLQPRGLSSQCRECTKARVRRAPPIDRRRRRLKQVFGLTIRQYEEMLQAQGGGCAICGAAPTGERYKNLAVDHCHASGKVRGLLCHRCNTAIGSFDDDPATIDRAAAYLRRST